MKNLRLYFSLKPDVEGLATFPEFGCTVVDKDARQVRASILPDGVLDLLPEYQVEMSEHLI